MNTIEKTEEVVVNKTRAIKANLKTRVKELAVIQKAIKATNKDIQRKMSKEGVTLCEKAEFSWEITITHILYNRLRRRPAHTGSIESDNTYMKEYGDYTGILEELESKFEIELGL